MSGFIHVSLLQRSALVLEYSHRGAHSLETDFLVERFLPRHGVQEDFLVAARQANEFGDDLLTKTEALMTRKESDVADVRTINSIRERSTNTDELAFLVYEALEHAVRERGL